VSHVSTPDLGTWLTVAYCTVDNFAGNVDGEATENFFHAQAVDGIGAGSKCHRRISERIVPIRVPACTTVQGGVAAQNFHRVVHTAIGRPGRVGTRLS
jgi:hypothetical protein